MLKFSGFHLGKPLILGIGALFLMFLTLEASAQSENEKVEEIYPKTNDRVVLEDHTLIQDNSQSRTTLAKPSASPKPAGTTVVKKEAAIVENASDREAKKTDSPSTLSFNIFLYIVDKFKAD
ncbi:hypothetical protein [Algoriphagus litoralis]|uniref:hypothetical protein n=1 Tax=Algoriphagus litoralis TaxID=2202829 RepID=UPI0013005070|nr:hypothetical protein [Algoriphagus litoralis]